MGGWIWIMPWVSAFAGWLLGKLFLFCLFRPYQPIKILGLRIQGFIPRRQERLAGRIGMLASQQTNILKEGLSSIDHAAGREALLPFLESHIDDFLRHRLPKAMPVISMFVGDKTINSLKEIFMKEMEELFPQVMERYLEDLQHRFNIGEMVRQRIAAIPPARLESHAYQVMGAGFRSISLLTAAAGFLTGLLYLTLIFIANS